MAQVFSISGAGGLGQLAPCPADWAVTPKGNCGAPLANCPPNMKVNGACRDQRAVALQTALKSLGVAVGDKALAAISIDGLVGPQTTALTNRAFTTHIGSGQAAARFRTGQLAQAQVANEAALMASVINSEVTRRGATPATPPVFAVRPGVVVPEPGPVVEMMPRVAAGAILALVGLNLVAAATGAYMAYTDRYA